MPDKGSLRAIKGARQKKKSFEEEVREKQKTQEARLNHVEHGLDNVFKAMNSLMTASNATTLLVASVETFLDKKHPGWDEGAREALKRKQDLMVERKGLHQVAARPRTAEGDDLEERRKTGERLWEIARELGSEIQDGTLAISLLLQAKEPQRAAEVLAAIEAAGAEKIPEQIRPIFVKLKERIAEVQKAERRLWIPGDPPPGVLPPPPGQ
jgi:hypothetical protein